MPLPPSLSQTAYALLDSGNGRKLEQFGPIILSRPCAQAVWAPQFPALWEKATASFTREEENSWINRERLPNQWNCQVEGLNFKLLPTDFGHLGVFPEHAFVWQKLAEHLNTQRSLSVLNLFAYSGGATLAAARTGARVCHVDSSKGMVAWARENAAINQLSDAPIRWIVEDAVKFLKREARRGNNYDAIILDPPSFGRGAQGEVFKIEQDLPQLLQLCRQVLCPKPVLVALSCHTPGYTPLVLHHLMVQMMAGIEGKIEAREMTLEGDKKVFPLPIGCCAIWSGR